MFLIGCLFMIMKNLRDLAICLLWIAGFVALTSCQDHKSTQKIKEPPDELIGAWVLSDRVIDGQLTPIQDGIIKLTFRKTGKFQASFQGQPNQKWVEAGQGVFSYDPPLLSLYWDSGRVVPLLLSELSSESLRFHHGRTTVPLKDQEADEVFKRLKPEKGPTRGTS